MEQDSAALPNNRSSLAAVLRARISDNHPIWDTLTKLAAPAALVISATSYLSGFVYKYLLAQQFGLLPGIIENTVQDTIAIGYIPVATGLFIVVFGLVGSWSLVFLINSVTPVFKKTGTAMLKVRHIIRELSALLNMTYALVLILGFGMIAGAVAAVIDADNYRETLNAKCIKRCYQINTSDGQFLGIILMQSKETTIAIGRSTAYIFPTSKLKSISPVNKEKGWQRLTI